MQDWFASSDVPAIKKAELFAPALTVANTTVGGAAEAIWPKRLLRRRRRSAGRFGIVIAALCLASLWLVVYVVNAPETWLCAKGHGSSTVCRGVAVSRSAAVANVVTEVRGRAGTSSYRRFFVDKTGHEISPWHDVPLETEVQGEFWMVTEIPKMTKPKMEIATKEPFNPIAQDVKKNKLREYHGPVFWNYGYLPQTWEDPTLKHPQLGVFGDDDPVDVVEIGARAHEQGEVVRVKVLGALAMIDDGELDWKVIAVAIDDPLAAKLQDIGDVEEHAPGVVSGIREWFRWYNTPDGKPLNAFGFGEAPLDRNEACSVIADTHRAWAKLRKGEVESKLWTGS
eukprot:TRINITY_DN2643_c0_g1_i5.p1 TRINITY_DN2643_c0_g1~~TRINITY_DN2643_c0_g1_i5.p1  ORF type:complete len:340 (+),score=48.21 TRINITY_DN2643_c0_g1_i5:48-1067(+)